MLFCRNYSTFICCHYFFNTSFAEFSWQIKPINITIFTKITCHGEDFSCFLSILLISLIVQLSSPKVGTNAGTANALWDMNLLYPESSLDQILRTDFYNIQLVLFPCLLYRQRKYFHLSQSICTIHLL